MVSIRPILGSCKILIAFLRFVPNGHFVDRENRSVVAGLRGVSDSPCCDSSLSFSFSYHLLMSTKLPNVLPNHSGTPVPVNYYADPCVACKVCNRPHHRMFTNRCRVNLSRALWFKEPTELASTVPTVRWPVIRTPERCPPQYWRQNLCRVRQERPCGPKNTRRLPGVMPQGIS